MFPNLQIPTIVDSYVRNLFTLYQAEILALHTKQWREESVKGQSNTMYIIQQYYLAMYYVLSIWYEVQEGYNTTWADYIEKYDINNIRKKLACNGIDLDLMLGIVGLPITDTGGGIGGVEIENTFAVEEEVILPDEITEDVTVLLAVQEILETFPVTEDVYDYALDYNGDLITT